MKKMTVIIALMLLSLPSIAQFDPETQLSIEYNNLNQNVKQQQNEIGNTIRSEVEAQARAKRQSTQSTRTNQSSNNQAVQSYNNRISAEGQQRMEYYNNPDNYINRDITNRRSSYFNNERRSASSQTRDLRTEPIHSENLNSKSSQSLRKAKIDYMFDENWELSPSVRAQLFDVPSLGEIKQKESINYFNEFLIERATERAKMDALKNKVARKNDMVEITKKGLGIIGSIATKGMASAGALVSANLNLYSELVKYWNECSSGARKSEGIKDTFDILGKATFNTAVDFMTPWVGDEIGAAYNLGKIGTDGMRVFTSMQIGLSLSDFAVSNEKQEE